MVSRTKLLLDDETIKTLFRKAGIDGVSHIAPLGAGEYNAVYEVIADKPYVLKVAPKADTPVLTYEKDLLKSEIFWYEQMRAHTSVHIPEIYFSDFERDCIPADYFIMEKIDGTLLNKTTLTKEEKGYAVAAPAQIAASLHKIKNDQFGYIQTGLYDNWYLAIRAMTANIVADRVSIGVKTGQGERLLSCIDRYRDILAQAACCMVDFDIHSMNLLCARENGKLRCTLLDPERSFWGDRIADFICLEMFLPLSKKEKTLRAYNAIADEPITVTRAEEIRYAVAQGYLGLLVDTERYYRYTTRNFGWWRNLAVSVWLFGCAFGVLGHGS